MTTRKKGPNIRAWLDFFMAALMIFFAAFMMFSKHIIGHDFFEDSPLLRGGFRYFFGGIFILYGLFRAYRGYISVKYDRNESN